MLESNPNLLTSPQAEDEDLFLSERFLSYVFHELRTPLTVVHSYAQIGLDKLPADPQFNKLRQIMNRMISQGEETVDMIEEVLEASRIPLRHLNLDQIEIEIAQLIEDTIEHLADELKDNINFVPGELPAAQVTADPPRIERVLITLIKFVLQEQSARNNRPQLNLTYRLLPSETQTLKIELQAPGLVFREEEQQDLFDLYRPIRQKSAFYTKAGSLDIGLYVSHGIIEAHGGKLDYLMSLPGFVIELPCKSTS